MKQLRWLIALIGIFYLASSLYFSPWRRGGEGRSGVLNWDVYGYSAYASGVLYGDLLELKFLDHIDTLYRPCDDAWGYGRFAVPNSPNKVCKYTIGNSYFFAPFYFGAHWVNRNFLSFPPDGYSRPYSIGICLGWWFWSLWGLYLLGLFLLQYFRTGAVLTSLAVIALATNFYAYTSQTVGMNHIPLFFCAALCLYTADLWAKFGQGKHISLFVLGLGLSVVLRPTELLLVLLLPALLLLIKKQRGEVWGFVSQRWGQILIAGLLGLLVGLPQIWYWYATTGKLLHYSYQGEGFDFSNPNIWKGLFSYRKGLFVYTPAMLLAFVGFLPLLKRNLSLGLLLLGYMAANIYLIFSWTAWSYGGSFGARSMIQSYALLAIPLAALFQSIFGFLERQPSWLRWLGYTKTAAVVAGFCYLNVLQTIQYHRVILHWDNMNKESYWYVFGKTNLNEQERNHANELFNRPIVD